MMKNLLKELKEFILRGNVVDLAVGFIIGAAFSGIVSSLVNDVLMPPLGLVLGKIDFSSMFISLSGEHYASLAAAKTAGAATINYGIFINALINFIIVAIVLFFIIRFVNHLQPKKVKVEEKPVKDCPFCFSSIPSKATRCPSCTSTL
jgi:large conductance mechanosensitive channel